MATQTNILLAEKSALRDELKHLKLCQLNYFTITVTATGALLGLGSKFGSEQAPALFFAPLVIVLPCWWIFFDKATTIARLVGYMTILDWLLSDDESQSPRFHYLAWEAALLHYRRQGRPQPNRSAPRQRTLHERARQWFTGLRYGITEVLTFQTTHRYWSINWYTYGVLSAVCWMLGSGVLAHGFTTFHFWSAKSAILATIAVSAVYNLYLSGDLVHGGRSYESHVRAWAAFLKPENVKEVLATRYPGAPPSRP